MEFDDTEPGDPKVEFLKRSHLFRALNDEQVNLVAEGMVEITPPPGRRLVRPDLRGNRFFLVKSGKVQVTPRQESRLPQQVLYPGDFFGHEDFFTRHHPPVNIIAVEETTFLSLSHKQLGVICKQVPALKKAFLSSIATDRLIRSKNFKWLQQDETIHFLARKHPLFLGKALITPVLLLVAAIILFSTLRSSSAFITPVLAWSALILAVPLGFWQWLDWGNDFFIVTNKRVIWLEKLIGIYDSRQEAPLSTILSAGVETGQIGRILDYGDVIIRTFVGQILFRNVHHPNQAALLIEEHWARSKESSKKEDASAMKQAIRRQLGLPPSLTENGSATIDEIPASVKPGKIQIILSNIFKVRFEENGTVTYRKHWLVLVKQTWQSGGLLLILLGFMLYKLIDRWAHPLQAPATTSFFSLLIIASFFVFCWWLYRLIDWKNDIFQVTPEQVIDIDRTPLGREEQRSSPLGNILSTEYRRAGLFQVLFNYGNVMINVGGSQLVFENVADPSSVQQDIDQRRLALIARQKESEKNAERDRMANWFAAYHEDAGEDAGNS